ncbi:transmembrane 9 superfamily member 5 [Phtheirospermum japonicum]|uniref:Transmembrane 9 superfamily member n=1 Tax=Phtheirospermum japonicum TaxID=374723 RepID=A0A830CUW8_9LAMI|nr:transmembrane 9 superfamily member 5 [Phtheirospermum japonicum]
MEVTIGGTGDEGDIWGTDIDKLGGSGGRNRGSGEEDGEAWADIEASKGAFRVRSSLLSRVESLDKISFRDFAERRVGRNGVAFLFALAFLGVFYPYSRAFVLNILATYYGVTAAFPLGTIFVIFLIYALLAIPLLVLGGFFGHRYKSDLQSSPVTKKCPREIPNLAWYRKMPAQMFLGGLLPFSAIVLEFHNLCATIWGYKIYTSPGILFTTLVVLVILTALMSVGLTYFQLVVEDHEWWWRSVLRGGSTAIFMFFYCIYFYFKSNMSGLLQTAFFFGYSFCLCYAFFLMLGAVSFQASLLFVRRIYYAVKSE